MNRKHSRVFYGWWVVVACVLISTYMIGVVVASFTALFEPIAKQFGWSYAQISVAASLQALMIGLGSPLVGFLVDRWDSRRLIFGGIIVSFLGFMLLSRATSLYMFYGAFILTSIGCSAYSSSATVPAVTRWFRQRAAVAIGIMVSGSAMAGILVPLVTVLIDTYGWKTALVSLSIGMLLIPLPLSLLVRNRPKEHTSLTDGDAGSITVVNKGLTSIEGNKANLGVKQALKNRAFWHITLGTMFQFLAISAVLVHVMPYLSSIGVTRSNSSLVASAILVISIFGRLSFGWIGDRFDKKRVTAATFLLTPLGLFFFSYAATGGVWLLIPFILLLGIGWGSQVTMIAALAAEYFGRWRFGTVFGFIHGILTLGGVIGPLLAGWAFDKWGSYQGLWFALIGLTIASVAVIATTPPAGNIIKQVDKPKTQENAI
jgi:MFS family permease